MKKSSSHSREQSISEREAEKEVPPIGAPRPPGKGLWRAFTSLRQYNFRLYCFGQLVSLLGTWMQSIGQVWLVLELTHSAWQLGLVGALQAVPILLFSIFGGIFADRWPKRQVLFLTQAGAMLQAFALWALVASGRIELWHLYILALLLGLTRCLDLPTRRAFIIEMVGREDLPNAIALNSSIATLTRIVGPGLGGLIIAASGVTSLFLLNAISFVAVLVALVLIRTRNLYVQTPEQLTEDTEKQSTWQSLHEGLNYVWKTPAMVLAIIVGGLVLLFGSNFNVVLPLIATDVLHSGVKGYGFLDAAASIGSLLAALWLAWRNQQSTALRLLICMLLFGILEVAFAISHLYLLSLVLIAGIGLTESIFASQAMTMLQMVTPGHLHGRVISVQVLFFDGSLPLGYMLMGWLSSLGGPSNAMLIGAILCVVVVGIGWIWRKAAERDIAVAAQV
ncbi:MFS transporter [Ktedonosporobacter rubrisoli]|uniref:MFS transporter n=1 Tax=Ktedonosporobacter rubrisoli TaxID=2509675 RepID=A0A4P6JM28_KTERU|nr:MFS transporter [Ktedonosporobacter rubrisoli]QBD76153.1 MFS transporter [Ktedonosporobacter rubrisoli]